MMLVVETISICFQILWNDVEHSYLGSYGVWTDRPNFSGQMDEFRMYNRALNDDEVAALARRLVVTPSSNVEKANGVYQIPSDMLTNGKIGLGNAFSSIKLVDAENNDVQNLTFDGVTVDGVDGEKMLICRMEMYIR